MEERRANSILECSRHWSHIIKGGVSLYPSTYVRSYDSGGSKYNLLVFLKHPLIP